MARRGLASDANAEVAYIDTSETVIELPGGNVRLTPELSFVGGFEDLTEATRRPIYRTLNAAGREIPGAVLPHPLGKEDAVKMYSTMARLQTMDTMFYDAQRQGRFSFYLTSQGEEATAVAAAAALEPEDEVFAQASTSSIDFFFRAFN
ncbi:hypothetical protein FOA52_008452 [Chlamydomonas sp. UWO 241]|nr:hypothetical protein FOA52_008452 [Chlamydomonas sp. UWO 241]